MRAVIYDHLVNLGIQNELS